MLTEMKVVIVGAGFGGIKAALSLAKDKRAHVTLISNQNRFEYHAALYRSVTGRSPLEVAIPLDTIFKHTPQVEIVEDVAVVIQSDRRTVVTIEGSEFHYDVLILALGNVTNYYGIEGLDKFSYGIKSINEALRLKRHLHDEMQHPSKMDNHYVVVGGGPTGVELAAELVSYLKRLYHNHNVIDKNFTVDLVEAAPKLLPNLPPSQSQKVAERLKRLGVNVLLNTAVKGETADELDLPEGNIKTHTVIWTAGVSGNPFFYANASQFHLGRGGHVEVDEHLVASNSIFVIGDAVASKFSGWAQTALYDGAYVAKTIIRSLDGQPAENYAPKTPIGAIPVGPKWCAVSRDKWTVNGYAGWIVRRYLDLKLFLQLLPLSLALKTWFAGNKVDETCPICRAAR